MFKAYLIQSKEAVDQNYRQLRKNLSLCVYKTQVSKRDAHDQISTAQFKLQQQ